MKYDKRTKEATRVSRLLLSFFCSSICHSTYIDNFFSMRVWKAAKTLQTAQ